MSINLNSIIFDNVLNKDAVLQYVKQEEIYAFYINNDCLHSGLINSPLREDNVPSFALFYHKNHYNKLMFYDFATKETGDCFIFVSKLFGLSMKNTFLRIAFDFKLSDFKENSIEKQQVIPNFIVKEKIDIQIRSIDFRLKDKWYWSQFKIKRSTLEKFNVAAISHIFYNDHIVNAESLAYAYKEIKDNIISYKIYQPESDKYKWINNADYSVHQGYTQLPQKGKLLIITKSLKDVMSIHDNCNISAVGLQSESVNIKLSVLEEYKSRFDKVLLLFDNDKPGVAFSKTIAKQNNIDYFLIPKLQNVKDFSDLVKHEKDALVIFNNSLKKLNKNE